MSKRANGEGSIYHYKPRNCYCGELYIGVDTKREKESKKILC